MIGRFAGDGTGSLEGAVGARSSLEERRAEGFGAAPGLRDSEIELSDGGLQGTWLETVGVPIALVDAFVGASLEVIGPFEKHGGVEDHFGDARKALRARVEERYS